MVSAFVMAPPAAFVPTLARALTITSADLVALAIALGIALGAALVAHRLARASRTRHTLRIVARATRASARDAA